MVVLSKEQQRWLEEVYHRLYRPLFYYAQSTLRSGDSAEEAVQSTFQIACARIQELVESPKPDGWLMNTLKFVLRNMQKKQMRTEAIFISSKELDENAVILSEDLSPETDAAFCDILGERDYQIFRRVTLKEMTIREAAQHYGLTEEACSKRLQRSRAKLRKHLQEEGL